MIFLSDVKYVFWRDHLYNVEPCFLTKGKKENLHDDRSIIFKINPKIFSRMDQIT